MKKKQKSTYFCFALIQILFFIKLFLFVSFFLGIALQYFVVETPGVQQLFKTRGFEGIEWAITIGLSVLPLIVHEIVVLIKYIHKKRKGV